MNIRVKINKRKSTEPPHERNLKGIKREIFRIFHSPAGLGRGSHNVYCKVWYFCLSYHFREFSFYCEILKVNMDENHRRYLLACPPPVITTEIGHPVSSLDEVSTVSKMVQLSIRSNTNSHPQPNHTFTSTDNSGFPVLNHSLTVPDFFPHQRRSSSYNRLYQSNGFNPYLSPHHCPDGSFMQARRHSHHQTIPYSLDTERLSSYQNTYNGTSISQDVGPHYDPHFNHLQDKQKYQTLLGIYD